MIKIRSLKYKTYLLIVPIIILTIILIFISVTMYGNVTSSVSEIMYFTDETVLNTITSQMKSEMNNLIRICEYLKNNKALFEYIEIVSDEDTSLYNKVKADSKIRSLLAMLYKNNDMVSDIVIKSPNHTYSHGFFSSGFSDKVWEFENGGETYSNITFHYPQNTNLSCININTHVIKLKELAYFSLKINAPLDQETEIYIVLKHDFFTEITKNNSDIYILDSNNKPLYYNEEDISALKPQFDMFLAGNTDRYKSKNIVMCKSELAFNGWKLIYKQDIGRYIEKYRFVLTYALFAFIIALVVSIILSKILSRQITRPITELVAAFKNYPEIKKDISKKQTGLALREKLFLYLILTVAMPITCFIALFNYSSNKVLEEQTIQSYHAVTEQIADAINGVINKKYSVLSHVVYDPLMLECDSLEPLSFEGDLGKMIKENVFLGLDNDRLEIYDTAYKLVFSNNIVASDTLIWDKYSAHVAWTAEKDSTQHTQLCALAQIRSSNDFQTIGYAKLSIAFSQIEELFFEIGHQNSMIYLVDSMGRDITNLNSVTYDKIYKKHIDNTPWSLIIRQSTEHGTLYFNTNMLLVTVGILLFISFIMSFSLLRPLGKVSKAMLTLNVGDPDNFLKDYFYIDEVNEITKYFNLMSQRIESLIDELIISNRSKTQLESERNKAEIVALQMQINPHFLANTIETISTIMQNGEIDKARTMLRDINNLFRYGISKSDYSITVREELRYAKAYTDIMLVRYPTLKFEWHIDDEILDCVTVKLILQPVIENAIYHGIRKLSSNGLITIKCCRENDNIAFVICDNGVGMSDERLSEVRQFLNDPSRGERIGICNVEARIRMTYGKKYGITIDSAINFGTQVRLLIPLRK